MQLAVVEFARNCLNWKGELRMLVWMWFAQMEFYSIHEIFIYFQVDPRIILQNGYVARVKHPVYKGAGTPVMQIACNLLPDLSTFSAILLLFTFVNILAGVYRCGQELKCEIRPRLFLHTLLELLN